MAIAVAVVFGGKGKLSGIMGDAAKGIRAFKDGLKGDEETQASPPPAAAAPGVLTSDAAARARAERETSIPRAEL